MKSNTDMHCDFCSGDITAAYRADPSPRGMVVHVCENCGLVQSMQTGEKPAERRRTTSSGADWGNVRHGKGARFKASLRIIDAGIPWASVRRVLDVGSNRGDFCRWLHTTHPHVAITAIEPDTTIVDTYKDQANLDLIQDRSENIGLPAGAYDFVYSSHTLEHAASAAQMLIQAYETLAEGGLMFLEIPNLDAIEDDNIVEEYFIDKHTFHFDRSVLVAYCEHLGFEVVQGRADTDPLNVMLLLRKQGPTNSAPFVGVDAERVAHNKAIIAKYRETLPRNREVLRRIVGEKLHPLAQRQRVGYWGAGRIFDALIRFGGLEAKDVHCLVDRFLGGILPEIHGIKVHMPEALKRLEPQVVVVLGRSSENEMARQAHLYGIRHVVKFTDLLNQCR